MLKHRCLALASLGLMTALLATGCLATADDGADIAGPGDASSNAQMDLGLANDSALGADGQADAAAAMGGPDNMPGDVGQLDAGAGSEAGAPARDAPLGAAYDPPLDGPAPPSFPFTPSNLSIAQLRLRTMAGLEDMVIDNPSCVLGSGIECTTGSLISHLKGFALLRIRNGDEPPFDVYIARSWTIRANVALTVRRVVLLALDFIAVEGKVGADGMGGLWSSQVPVPPWSGPGAGAGGDYQKGAGGGAYCGNGGAGTHATAPRAMSYGNETLIPPGEGSAGGSAFGGNGGSGGGFLQLVAGRRITIAAGGKVTSAGLGGWPDGGGGGSGGGLLLEAPVVQIAGAVAANGGGGAGARFGINARGEDGRGDATAAAGGTDVIKPAGGNGGAGASTMGIDGNPDSQTGGGGGAAGRIRINSSTPPEITGIVSPAAGSGCLSFGSLGSP
jgi:hypothetical protein